VTKLIARDGCREEYFQGQERPKECPHGEPLFTEKRRADIAKRTAEDMNARQRRTPRRALKRSEPDRDWSLAQTKKEEEGCCRICKRTDLPLESAHILGREHDEPKLGADGWPLKELLVHPDRIIPACGPFPGGCHGAMHRHEVDVLQNLTLEEQLQAVKDAGSIEAAHIRLTAAPSAYAVEAAL
jgi:hypothetical protein